MIYFAKSINVEEVTVDVFSVASGYSMIFLNRLLGAEMYSEMLNNFLEGELGWFGRAPRVTIFIPRGVIKYPIWRSCKRS